MSKMKLILSLFLHASFVVLADSESYYSRADPLVPFADSRETDSSTIKVQFYGESQCPFCRKFVTETWNDIWKDAELKAHVDYEFVPWGNSYFATAACGKGPYDPKERACFYDHCITNRDPTALETSTPDDDCFTGEPIYQHSQKEGQVDIYESCIIRNDGWNKAVAFTYCAEGDLMDNAEMSAHELLLECAADADIDVDATQSCLEGQGRRLEIANAQKTPAHAGVPYVLVDGKPLEDPFHDTKTTLCKALSDKGVHPLPTACTATTLGGQSRLPVLPLC